VDLTNDDVADILALLDSLPYDSLDLRTDKFRLTLRRAPSGGWTEESELLADPAALTPSPSASSVPTTRPTTTAPRAPSPADARSPAEAPSPAHAPSRTNGVQADGGGETNAGQADASGADPSVADASGLVAVVAPLPGTFYRAPRPGAPPFVEVGDAVGADTVVAIIETMKLMNSVHAGTPGAIARILLENGEFAPLGAALLLIEPDTSAPIDPDARLPIDPDS
jgi:acetyl-CoA carboxylase biotin carboxyl carrier protein